MSAAEDMSAQEAFIEEEFEILAALAYRSYRQKRRGGLVVSGAIPTRFKSTSRGVVITYHTTFGHPDADRMVSQYDPEREFCVFMAYDDGTCNMYHIRVPDRPVRLLYERHKDRIMRMLCPVPEHPIPNT